MPPSAHLTSASGNLFALLCALTIMGCDRDATISPNVVPAARHSQPESPQAERAAARSVSTLEKPHGQPDDLERTVDVATSVVFVDVAHERGLNYQWPDQPRPMKAIDAFGAGCAAFDCDDDGWQDILLIGDPHPSLFHNTGGGQFEDVTKGSGLAAVDADWTGCAIGDYDADGLLDVLLTGYRRLALYRNLGGLRFEEATAAAGLDPFNNQYWGSSAGFMDLDGDRRLDLVILNYVVFGPESQQYCEYAPGVKSGCGPRTYPPQRGQIWRNTGASGFELVPDVQGMRDTQGAALVLGFTDLDGDGRMDFYIGNDGLAADLMHNQGGMRFKNIAFEAGVSLSDNALALSAMAADWADFDRDGLLDLFVTNWQGSPFVIFRALGQNLFIDCSRQTDLAQITRTRMGFGGKWVDFENDGWPDLFIVNGHVYDNVNQIKSDVQYRQPILLLSNSNGHKFVDVVPALGAQVQRPMVGRGSATADFDNDGLVDLLAVDFEGPVMLLQNRTATKNHWLTLDLRGASPNIFAYGARVVGRAGGQSWIGEVSPASSYLSSSDPRIHWGLGEVTRLETLTIRWPAGEEQTLRDVTADQILRVVE